MATGGNLGGATFTLTVNTQQFVQALAKAQVQAQAAGKQIGANLYGGANHAAMGFLELSRAIEDAQYGFRGVVNNIPQMVMLFGGGAGLAAAVSLTAVGVNQLVEHWGYLSDAMQAAWSGSTIEQLQKIRQTAEEAAEAFDKLAKTPTELEVKGAKAMEKMIVEGPAGKVLEQVLAGVAKTPGLKAELTDREKAALGSGMGVGLSPIFPFVGPRITAKTPAEREAAIAAEVDRRNREKAAGLIGEMSLPGKRGAAARRTVATIAPGLAGDLEASSPEGQKRQAEFARAADARKEVQRRIARAEQEQARKLEERLQAEARADRAEKEARDDRIRRLMKGNEQQMEMEADALKDRKRAEADRKRAAQRGVRLRHRIFDIVEGMQPEKAQAEFMGFAEFHKSTQMGILNGPNDVQKRQLAALEKIRDLLEENPDMKANIMGNLAAAVAAGPN